MGLNAAPFRRSSSEESPQGGGAVLDAADELAGDGDGTPPAARPLGHEGQAGRTVLLLAEEPIWEPGFREGHRAAAADADALT